MIHNLKVKITFFCSANVKSFSSRISTGNLNRHLLDSHNLRESDTPVVKTLETYFGTSAKRVKVNKDEDTKWYLSRDLVLWMCRDLLPFNMISKDGIKHFFKTYKIVTKDEDLPHPSTLQTTALSDVYETVLKLVKDKTNDQEEFAITFDLWSDNYRRRSYITFTMHFIDLNFILQSLTLETKYVSSSHTGECILEEVIAVTEDFGIPLRKNFVVTDQGSNVKKAIRLGQMNSHFCLGHGLHNLLTVDGYDSVSELKKIIIKTKKIVKTLRYKTNQVSSEANAIQKEILSKINNLDELLSAEDDNWELDDEGFNALDDVPLSVLNSINVNDISGSLVYRRNLTLKNSTPTRWHSVLALLESFNSQNAAINKLLSKDKKYDLILSDEEDLIIFKLQEFLQKFKDGVNCMSGDKYVSLSLCLVLRTEIEEILTETPNDHYLIAKLKKNMAERLNYRFPVTDILITASLLDPRFHNLKSVDSFLKENLITKTDFLKQQFKNLIGEEYLLTTTDPAHQTSGSKILNLAKKHSKNSSRNSDIDKECHILFSLTSDQDPLLFWKEKYAAMPLLTKLARKVLCIPATSTPSERVFSVAGLTITNKRSNLAPQNVNKIIFIHDNYDFCSEK